MAKTSQIFDALFSNRIINHILFWVAAIGILAYHGSLFGGTFGDNLIELLAMLPSKMAAAYLLVYFLIPRFIYQRKWILFLLFFIASAYLLSVLARLSIIHIAEPILHHDGYDESLWEVIADPVYLLKVYVVSLYIPAFILFSLKLTKDRFQQENKILNLEKEKSSAELNFLKAQMNPHFLFNTLNNIYALAKEKSDQAPEMIMQLSEILDYTIYECNQDIVHISKEWELIENYVEIQRPRYAEQLVVSMQKRVDDDEAKVAPLILITLVENAFKHTLISPKSKPTIKINLSVKGGKLDFEVFNTKSTSHSKKVGKKKGIGVQNLKRQLENIYPEQYNLTVNEQEDSYHVNLSINLERNGN